MRILILDDDHDWLHSSLVARLLKKAGFTEIVRMDRPPLETRHAKECMWHAEDAAPWACDCPRTLTGIDVVLTDWQPYGPDTVVYAQTLGVPVVVYTAEPAAVPSDLSVPVVDKMYVNKYLVLALMQVMGKRGEP